MKQEKRPFEVGQRVRVKDLDQSDGRECSDTGRVIAVSSDGVKVVYDHWKNAVDPDGEKGMWVFPRQCVRLKKREKRGRVEAIGRTDGTFVVIDYISMGFGELGKTLQPHNLLPGDNRTAFNLKEVRPGERVLSLEDFAKAWDRVFPNCKHDNSMAAFPGLCQALGFEAEAK